MGSSLLDQQGQMHIITGKITVNSDTWTLTTNDGSATLTDNGAGDVTVNFVEPFLSAPACTATPIKATHEATVFYNVKIEQLTTALVQFHFHHDTAGTNTTADPDDDDGWSFIVVGLRDN